MIGVEEHPSRQSSVTSPLSLDKLANLDLDKLANLDLDGDLDQEEGNVDLEENVCQSHHKTVVASCKKRKRMSFRSPGSMGRMTEKVRKDVKNMLKYVPKIDELFTVTNKIGEGTFSTVYRATLKQQPDSDQVFALKHIIPTSHPDRILSELSCLVRIGGCHNVMGVKLTLREKDNIVIVMPYFQHSRFQDFYQDMSVSEVQEYLRNLLIALRRVHRFNVIHRDVKPGNFLYDRISRKYALVDFGLAQAVPVGSKSKTCSKGSTVGGVLHQDTPKPPQLRKHTRRAVSVSENKTRPKAEPKRLHSESRPSAAPRLTELDPNTFQHSTDRSSRSQQQRLNSLKEDIDLQKNGTRMTLRGSENIEDVDILAAKKERLKPVILPRKNTSLITTRGVKKAQERGVAAVAAATTREMCNCFGRPQVCDVCLARKNQVAPRAGTPGFRSPEVLLKCPDQTTAVDMWAAGVIFLSILSGRYPFFRAPDDLTALAQIMSIMGTEETKQAAEANGKNLLCSVKLPAMELQTMCRQLRLGSIQHRHTTTTITNGTPGRRYSNGEASKRRRRSNGHATPPCLRDDKSSVSTVPNIAGSTLGYATEGSSSNGNEDIHDEFPDSAYDLLTRLLELDPKKRISAEEALKHPFLSEVL